MNDLLLGVNHNALLAEDNCGHSEYARDHILKALELALFLFTPEQLAEFKRKYNALLESDVDLEGEDIQLLV